MARQSIPRFDLYGELGVGPWADFQAVEDAYSARIERPDLVGTNDRRRLARLNLAREWLTDPELRSRYDVARTRAAERAAMGATASRRSPRSTAGTTRNPARPRAKPAVAPIRFTAMEPDEAEAASEAIAAAAIAADISWPAADLERATTRVVPRPRRPPLMLAGVAGLAAVVAIGALVALAISTRPASAPVAVATPTAPGPTQTANVETPSPQPGPTLAASTAPVTPVPIDTVALQQAAWNTIQALAAAARVGDVATAQTMLGDTAPELHRSGLKRAVFPDVPAAALSVMHSGLSYTATAGADRLTSIDGVTWTFDYADRPLRAYTPTSSEAIYDLFWVEADGKHHLYLRLALATVSTSGVTARVVWSYDPSLPDDATYFGGATLLISSVILDDTPIPVTSTSMPMLGVTTLTPTATFTGVGFVPQRLAIGITVRNPRSDGSSDRAVETTFALQGR